MIPTMRQTLWSVLAFGIAAATPAFAQAPSEAQREAIKSNCRSDYMAHCSSIPPGGAASLECLQKNMSSLSGSCASAVKAVEAPAETKAEPAAAPKESAKETPKQETKTEPAPAAVPAKAAAEPAAATKAAATPAKPTSAQIAAIRSSCRSDYPKVCAGVPTGGAPALECLEKNKAKLSAACGKAVAAAGGGGAAPAAGAAPASANAAPAAAAPAEAAPAAATAPLRLRPMLPREVLFVARSACGADVRALCAGIPVGGGRIVECLASQPAALSPACRQVLGQFAAARAQ